MFFRVETNPDGSFSKNPFSHNVPIENFRVPKLSTITIFVPAGAEVNQKNVTLQVTNAIGDLDTLRGETDELGNWCVSWEATTPGPNELVVVCEEFNTSKPLTGSTNVIIVEPRLVAGDPRTEVPTNGICMQTVIPRCLGTIDTWAKRLAASTADIGYNAVHFTPLQVPGESGSCYSLANQLELSPELFPEPVSKEEGFKRLSDAIKEIESRNGLLCTVDIVLNHTASNTVWIKNHPECGYNVSNCPYLRGAYDLEQSLLSFSDRIVDGKYSNRGLTANIDHEGQISILRQTLEGEVVKPFRMSEWFELDMERSAQNFREAASASEEDIIKDPAQARDFIRKEAMKGVGIKRGKHIAINGSSLRRVIPSNSDNHMRDMLSWLQGDLYRLSREAEESVLAAVEGTVRWERLSCHKGPLTKSRWNSLVPRYFTTVEKDGTAYHLANNGWIMNWDATKDFAAPGELAYLRRDLIVWSDCIKLRYGDKPEDCPFLWNLMKEYCTGLAQIFHGFRLDNCHSTPINLAKYLLRESRRVRPDLWVYAELFTGNQMVDLHFERELGLNALIREAMQTHSPQDLAAHIWKYGGRAIGCLSEVPAIDQVDAKRDFALALRPTPVTPLFYDCTHDNETPASCRSAVDALSNAAAVASSLAATGSSRGYDELIPRTLSVVTEKRLYKDYSEGRSEENQVKKELSVEKKTSLKTFVRPDAQQLCIRGSWDGWKHGLRLEKENGFWTAAELDKQLGNPTKGTQFQFKFVANETEWLHDPGLPTACDASGNVNNVLTAGVELIGGASMKHRDGDINRFIDAKSWTPRCDRLPGIMEAKAALNKLHSQLAADKFSELFVDVGGPAGVIIVTRHQPATHRSCIFIIHTSFTKDAVDVNNLNGQEISLPGKVVKVKLEARLSVREKKFDDSQSCINGYSSHLALATNVEGMRSTIGAFIAEYLTSQNCTKIKFTNFVPGSVAVFMIEGAAQVREHFEEHVTSKMVREIFSDFKPSISSEERASLLLALNYLLYDCEQEERDHSGGTSGVYGVPGYAMLPYAGIGGVVPIFDKLRFDREVAHPLFDNLREGDWLLGFMGNRLAAAASILERENKFSKASAFLRSVSSWLNEATTLLSKSVPRSSMPYYVDRLFSALYSGAAKLVLATGNVNLQKTASRDPFVKYLMLATLQFYSFTPSAPLIWTQMAPSLCAGLPHFSTQFMRNWGRDTFIAFKGCLLVPGRFEEAKAELMGYARVMRHGLIPNLLDSGNNPRFNARDATWFFLQAVQDYCTMAPNGLEILKETVDLKYRDVAPKPSDVETLGDLVIHILRSHANGIHFREVNAGSALDEHMRDEGFDVTVDCEAETGFIYGGNKWNCGTWMDKMGSSAKAGNKGIPATPRDGADVEIIGLLESALRFFGSGAGKAAVGGERELEAGPETCNNNSDNSGINRGRPRTLANWSSLLQANFEKHFYIPTPEEEGNGQFVVDKKLINRRGIYKDVYKCHAPWCDVQLRCNFPIAMAVSPELFSPDKALKALHLAEKVLFPSPVNPKFKAPTQLGMKTLDPSDLGYRPVYDNSNDGEDRIVAHGWNYHQGPEWVWPLGYFLEALYEFEGRQYGTEFARHHAMKLLLAHRQFIVHDAWRSLPELTNLNGEFCSFSCTAQAWSIGTLLSFLWKLLSSGAAPAQKQRCAPEKPCVLPQKTAASQLSSGTTESSKEVQQ